MPRGWRKDTTVIITTGRKDHLFVHTKKTCLEKNEFALYPQYFLGTRDGRAYDRSVVEKIHKTHKTFTPYDIYDFEKSVTLRTPG